MTTETNAAAPAAPTSACETVRIRAHYGVVRKLGHWTTSRRMDVRASRGHYPTIDDPSR